jgi:mono/diheme cytochrome c family protein
MTSLDTVLRFPALRIATAAGALCTVLALPVVGAADQAKPASPMTQYQTEKGEQPQDSGAKAADQPDTAAKAPEFSAHSTFSNICGFCHEDGGRRAGKGPQLMGTEKTDEQIFNRIKFGKPGRMAAFGGAFTDDQIKQLIVYIRNLKPRQ